MLTACHIQGLTDDEMLAHQGDLCTPGEENPEPFRDSKFFNFDMACVGLGFHHFDDPALAAKRLVSRLKAGGVLMIIDFLPHGTHADHEGHSHVEEGNDEQTKAMKTVMHHGFTEEYIKEIFVDAGAGKDFGIEMLGEVKMGPGSESGRRDLFMARGTRA